MNSAEDPDKDQDSTEGYHDSSVQLQTLPKGNTHAVVLKPIDKADNKRVEQIELKSNSSESTFKNTEDTDDIWMKFSLV